MTKEEFMLLVRDSYPGDSIQECITEEGEVIPYRDSVGDGLAEFVTDEMAGAFDSGAFDYGNCNVLELAIERLTNAMGDLDAVREALETERDFPTVSALERAADNVREKRREWMYALRNAVRNAAHGHDVLDSIEKFFRR